MGTNVCQNRTQNVPKLKTKTKTKKEAFQDRLGAVLGPIWVDLGAHLGVKFVLSPRAGLVFLKNDVFEKIRCQEATWAELGPTWAPKRGPKWSPKASQDGAKKEKKNEVNLGRV